jgi:predicted TIM-barrel fold metal-dependent hydrolase
MVIDFHTHIFPDFLAPKAIYKLTSNIDNIYPPVHDGTAAGQLKNMGDWGIDTSVVLPIVTKPTQVKTLNEWSAGVCSDRLIGFGGIYPHSDSYKSDIDFVVGLGLRGLKFHAEYQDFLVDDIKMLRIYDYAFSKGLIILHHGGFDPGFLPPFKSSPKQFANILKEMRGGVLIVAHLGGHDQWDDVERYLVGTDIYLDTSMGLEFYPTEQFLSIVKNHGADKILFGSDAPWSNAKTEIEHIRSLPLESQEIDAILGENAKKILKI